MGMMRGVGYVVHNQAERIGTHGTHMCAPHWHEREEIG
jgi:hypothetical protein